MKKLLFTVALFSFISFSYANPCEDGKKCDKKECTQAKSGKKECSSKDAKKACCSKDKETASMPSKSSCTSADKAAGKSCCSKSKVEDKK